MYDWQASAWTQADDLLQGRQEHGCIALEGQGVLVTGGLDEDYENVYTVELYNIIQNKWIPQADLPYDLQYTEDHILLNLDGAVIALFNRDDRVFRRGDDGAWSVMEGVRLPRPFSGYDFDRAVLVPEYFSLGCI